VLLLLIASVIAARVPETLRHPIKVPFSFVSMAVAGRNRRDNPPISLQVFANRRHNLRENNHVMPNVDQLAAF
jgi:hypothetical protein